MQNSFHALRDQKYEDVTMIIKKTSQYLDLYIQNIKNILLVVTEDPIFINENAEQINANLKKYAENNLNVISNIFLVYEDGRIFSNNQVLYDIIGHDKLNYIIDTYPSGYTGISWSEPYSSRLAAGNTIAFIKPIYNKEKALVGHAVIEINLQYLSRQLVNLLDSSYQSFIILTQKNNIVASNPELSDINSHDPQYIHSMLDKLKSGIDLTDDDTSVMTIMDDDNQIGWKLIVATDEEYFLKSTKNLFNKFLIIGVIYLFLIVIFTLLLSLNFTRPIKKLAFQMDNVHDESLSIAKLSYRKDELGKLTRSFEDMMERIKSLMKQQRDILENKRQIELKLLQKQINPHFLGNTLACISSLAKCNQMDMVQEMIRSLILMLNFSMDRIDEFITLKDEIKFIEEYIKLLKMRHGEFQFLTVIPKEHESIKIPKLILQPLIENAYLHGISTKKSDGCIIIETLLLEETFHIFISDNGPGMSPEKVKTVLSPGDSGEHGEPRGNSHGMGIRNVNERIKLYFGKEYGLYIASEPGKGTKVEICLPKDMEQRKTDENLL